MATCEKCMHEKCCIFAAECHTLFTKGDCEYYDNADDYICIHASKTKKLTYFNKIKNSISAHQMARLIYDIDSCSMCEYSNGDMSCHAPAENFEDICKGALEKFLKAEETICEDGSL